MCIRDSLYVLHGVVPKAWWDEKGVSTLSLIHIYNIATLRKKSKITQQELADAVLVTRQTIISLEKEKYTASLILAYKIARYFDLSIEEVFNFSEEDENCDK